MSKAMKSLLPVLLTLASLPALADVVGRVVNVADGDTLTVLVDERDQLTVRLAGIDAPERQQSFGRQSQNNLSALTFGKTVRVGNQSRDANGHVVARVWLAAPNCQQPTCTNGTDVGLAQVTGGFAWNSKGQGKELTAEERERYGQAELLAKLRRLGLWAEPKPVAPWAWRHNRLDE